MPAASSLSLEAAVNWNSKRNKVKHSTVCRERTFMMCQCKLPLSLANMTDWCHPVMSDGKMGSKPLFQISSNVKFSACHSLKNIKKKCIDFIRKICFSLVSTNKYWTHISKILDRRGVTSLACSGGQQVSVRTQCLTSCFSLTIPGCWHQVAFHFVQYSCFQVPANRRVSEAFCPTRKPAVLFYYGSSMLKGLGWLI